MSSLLKNSTVSLDGVNKRKASFSRSDSLDKLQYTALFSLQLAGTLLSQKSLLRVMDELQYKSRLLLEKHLLQTVWPTIKMMYTTTLLWIIRYTSINSVFQKKTAQTTCTETEKKLRVSKWKNIETSIPNTEVKTNDSIEEKRLKLIAEFDSRLNPSHAKQFKSSDSESELGSNHNISSRPNLGMVVIVYGSATLVYIQLMVLAAFLQTAVIPPGLVFLVSSLGYIWYVAFKICFVKAKQKDDSSTKHKSTKKGSTKQASTEQASTEEATIEQEPVASEESDKTDTKNTKKPARIGRSYTRRFLYFHNKTLSKIKLL